MYGRDQSRHNKLREWQGLLEAMKELDRIKTIEHFNFDLRLEGNDIGSGSENC